MDSDGHVHIIEGIAIDIPKHEIANIILTQTLIIITIITVL